LSLDPSASISIVLLFPLFNTVPLKSREGKRQLKEMEAELMFLSAFWPEEQSSCEMSCLDSINLPFSRVKRKKQGVLYQQNNFKIICGLR
jgi:hypothetical protein